jgi:heme-degrading monooxygenase HmoA
MFAVIFEVEPKPERFDDYLALAGALRPELERIEGFIGNERFRGLRDQGRILSLSIWHDEKALVRWRTQARHHEAQERGRYIIFRDYRLRVGEILSDSKQPGERSQQRLDATEVGAASVTVTEIEGGAMGDGLAATLGLPIDDKTRCLEASAFESLTTTGKRLLLASWHDQAPAECWTPRAHANAALRHRRVRIIRDYGMNDRREAPQYYPPAER